MIDRLRTDEPEQLDGLPNRTMGGLRTMTRGWARDLET